jgi:hypothetical protein
VKPLFAPPAVVTLAVVLIVATSPARADEPGDSPLTLLYQSTGNLALAHSVAPLGGPDSTGTFTIAGLPVGAAVERAYFITGIWDDIGSATHTMDLDFDGTPYPDVPADVVDFAVEVGGLDLGGYAVDVTADVPGDGSYPFTASPNQSGTGTSGALLVVVYTHASNPANEVILNFGAEGIRNGSSTTEFPGLAASGGELFIWTEADNAFFSDPVEEIVWNGAIVAGGPFADIFDANQGCCTSFFGIPVTVADGLNTATINNGQDLFGWHYAGLVLPASDPIPVTPVSWGSVKGAYR